MLNVRSKFVMVLAVMATFALVAVACTKEVVK